MVKALRYKPAGRGFDSRWCHWNFSVTHLHFGTITLCGPQIPTRRLTAVRILDSTPHKEGVWGCGGTNIHIINHARNGSER